MVPTELVTLPEARADWTASSAVVPVKTVEFPAKSVTVTEPGAAPLKVRVVPLDVVRLVLPDVELLMPEDVLLFVVLLLELLNPLDEF